MMCLEKLLTTQKCMMPQIMCTIISSVVSALSIYPNQGLAIILRKIVLRTERKIGLLTSQSKDFYFPAFMNAIQIFTVCFTIPKVRQTSKKILSNRCLAVAIFLWTLTLKRRPLIP